MRRHHIIPGEERDVKAAVVFDRICYTELPAKSPRKRLNLLADGRCASVEITIAEVLYLTLVIAVAWWAYDALKEFL